LASSAARPLAPRDFDLGGGGPGFHREVAGIRRSRGPVLWSERHRAWLVLSHAAATSAFRHPGLSSDRTASFQSRSARAAGALDEVADLLAGWMVFRDPPAHDQLRAPVAAAFTPRRVSALERAVTVATDRLIERLEQGPSGEGRSPRPRAVDLRRELAGPLPATVIAELLGIPEDRRGHLREWSDGLAGLVFAIGSGPASPELVSVPARAAAQMSAELSALLDHYRGNPADNLLTALSSMAGGESALSDQEVVGAAMLLLFAGHETTTTLICNSVWSLLAWPDELARLKLDPDRWIPAVDELLRFEGPSRSMVRKVAGGGPVSFEGCELSPGENVFIVIAAANRDEAVFHDPDDLDLSRQPNPHLGFGWGRHHCLGAALARVETRICLSRIFERYPELTTLAPVPAWGGGVIGRSVGSLEVRLQP
jgi:cytochrome P450